MKSRLTDEIMIDLLREAGQHFGPTPPAEMRKLRNDETLPAGERGREVPIAMELFQGEQMKAA